MKFKQKIVFEFVAHNEIKKFQNFWENYKKDHIFTKETTVFNWQHKGHTTYNFMAAKQGNEFVGAMGFIPFSHFDSELSKNQVLISGGFFVLEDRGIGIGLRLFQKVINHCKPEFVSGTGLNKRLIKFHEWQGFNVFKMDHHVFLSPYINEFRIAKLPDKLKIKTKNNKSGVKTKILSHSDLHNLDTETLYSHQLPIKSDTYIKNRYMNHPVYKYDVYSIRNNKKTIALCVIRPVFIGDSVVLRFVDFIGPNDSFHLLNDFILYILNIYEAEYVDLYSIGIPSSIIKKAGFLHRQKIDGLVVPDHFEPFEKNNIELYFAYKSLHSHPPVRLFKGDGDQDRPNVITETSNYKYQQ